MVLFATAAVAVVAPTGQAVAMLADRPEKKTDIEARRFASAEESRGL